MTKATRRPRHVAVSIKAAQHAVHRAMTEPGDGSNIVDASLISALDRWHHLLAQVSGTLVLAFGKTGLSAKAGRAVIVQLRSVADDMETNLKLGNKP